MQISVANQSSGGKMLTNGVRGELDPATDIEMLDEE